MLSFRILIFLTLAVLTGTGATVRASASQSAEDQGEREAGRDPVDRDPVDRGAAERPNEGAFGDEITVRAQPLEQIETRSLEVERAALPILEASTPDQLGRFPDRDAAGAAQRLPGVTVLHEQGDARLVLIRGFLPSFNSATLDGERIPAGEADERAVALDLVPTELLESVQLTKTLTPDLDGDAIGGTIDLVTRRPPRGARPELSGSLGTGHDDGSDGARGLATLSWGRWLTGPELGVRLSASRVDADRGVDSVETEWDDEELTQVRRQDHEVERNRQGAAASFEWLPGATSSLQARGLWSEFDDLERRRASVRRLDEEVQASELKDRLESQSIESLAISGERLAGRWLVEPRVSWNRGQESDPDRLDTIFVLETPEADSDHSEPPPEVSPEEFVLDGFRTESDRSENEDLVAALDVSRARPSGQRTWRAGAKWRHKRLWRDQNLLTYEFDDDETPIRLSEVVGAGWSPRDPFFGRPEFDLGPFPDPGIARSLFERLGLEGERDPEEDVGDFSAEEDVAALYGLAEWAVSDSVSWVAGVRYESTKARYVASEVVLDPDDEIEIAPLRGDGSYGEVLPSAVLRAALGERDVLRVALGRSLARPNLEDLAPSRLVIAEDEEIIVGNPELRPTTSWNLDVQWERRLEPLGSLSLSAYAKDLSDVAALVRSRGETDGGIASFTTVQPRNAGTASIVGLELSFQNRVRNGPLKGLGMLANVSWSDATAELEGRPTQSLPGQAERSASAVLSYERARISARLLYSYRGEILEELGESPSLDVYLEDRSQLDLSIQVQASRSWAVFLEAFNLTQERVRQFEGSPLRPVFDERIGWWASVGLRFDL